MGYKKGYYVGVQVICIKEIKYEGKREDILIGDQLTIAAFTHGDDPNLNTGIRFYGHEAININNFPVTKTFVPLSKLSKKDLFYMKMSGRVPTWVRRMYLNESP